MNAWISVNSNILLYRVRWSHHFETRHKDKECARNAVAVATQLFHDFEQMLEKFISRINSIETRKILKLLPPNPIRLATRDHFLSRVHVSKPPSSRTMR